MELFADVSSAAPKISLPLLWLLADCHGLYFAPRVLTSLQTLANYLIIGETVPFLKVNSHLLCFTFSVFSTWKLFQISQFLLCKLQEKERITKRFLVQLHLRMPDILGNIYSSITDGFLDLCYKGLKFCSCCIFTHICSPTRSPSVGINSVKQ